MRDVEQIHLAVKELFIQIMITLVVQGGNPVVSVCADCFAVLAT